MNKAELVSKVAETTKLSKKDTEITLNGITEVIKDTLKKGEDVQLIGFGTFSSSKREARTGRNPQTGETINIPASVVPKFKAGKALKEALNK